MMFSIGDGILGGADSVQSSLPETIIFLQKTAGKTVGFT